MFIMMFNQRDELGFIIVVMLMIILAVLIRSFIRHKREQLKRLEEAQAQGRQAQPDQNNIYNISGRVQGPHPQQYPDPYLSVEHIAITNELNKPPKYDDAPPSYDEAIKLAMAHSNSIQTYNAEQIQNNQSTLQSSASSTVPTTVTVVVPAVPSTPTRTE